MKGCTVFLLTVLVALNLINYWRIQQLQQQVAVLRTQVRQTEVRNSSLPDLLEKALPLLTQAQSAIRKDDTTRARRMLEQAMEHANEIHRTFGERAAPVVTWLREQAQHLEDQINTR